MYLFKVLYDNRDISADDDFFAAFALHHKNYGHISIQLSTRTLNYAMKLPTFIESFLIFIHSENLSIFYLPVYLKLTKHNSKIQATMFFYPRG